MSSATDDTRQAVWHGAIHSLLRVVTGLLFMQHGVQKLFGLLLPPDRAWNGAPEIFTQYWFAGVLEVFGGALIVVGLLTRPVAFLLSGQMAVAYFQAHAPRSFWPILNGGEPSVLFSFIFLYLFAVGAGPYSIDAMLRRRRGRMDDATALPSIGETGRAPSRGSRVA